MESNVCHILTNGEPLYDAYTTYLPGPCSVARGEKYEKKNPRAKRAERKLSSGRGKGCIIVVMSSLVNMFSDVM